MQDRATPSEMSTTIVRRAPRERRPAQAPRNRHLHDGTARRVIRTSIISAVSVLAAFTLRDFMQSVLAKIANKSNLIVHFVYTVIVFFLMIWIAYIWD